MNGKSGIARWAIAAVLFLCSFCLPVSAAETFVTRTNWVEKTITNVIEVSVPKNVFVNTYRTNVLQQFRTIVIERNKTNIVNLYVTNQMIRTITNTLAVDVFLTNVITAFRTNAVSAYRTNVQTRILTNEVAVQLYRTNVIDRYYTNVKTLTFTNEVAMDSFRTNLVDRYHTNLKTLTFTNEVAVNSFHTNFIDSYRTNVKVLTFTNWETVIAMRTNWVAQQLTNFVQVDVPANGPGVAPNPTSKESPASAEPRTDTSTRSGSTMLTDSLVLDAERVSRPAPNNLFDVVVRVHWAAGNASAPKVQQWRIEHEDGAFLSFGQDQDLRKQVPIGTYKLEAKVLRESDNILLVARGTLIVTAKDVVVHQKPAGKRLASAGL